MRAVILSAAPRVVCSAGGRGAKSKNPVERLVMSCAKVRVFILHFVLHLLESCPEHLFGPSKCKTKCRIKVVEFVCGVT